MQQVPLQFFCLCRVLMASTPVLPLHIDYPSVPENLNRQRETYDRQRALSQGRNF
jgi:hypothetical protein